MMEYFSDQPFYIFRWFHFARQISLAMQCDVFVFNLSHVLSPKASGFLLGCFISNPMIANESKSMGISGS
jgi:hypothetical protein